MSNLTFHVNVRCFLTYIATDLFKQYSKCLYNIKNKTTERRVHD